MTGSDPAMRLIGRTGLRPWMCAVAGHFSRQGNRSSYRHCSVKSRRVCLVRRAVSAHVGADGHGGARMC
jgi:hypothetical protein